MDRTDHKQRSKHKRAAIIGGGPAGLYAADKLTQAGIDVDLYDKKARPGRKFLLAGQSGLNMGNDESLLLMSRRYGVREEFFRSLLEDFSAEELRNWLAGLGVETFRGSGGRIFPKEKSPREVLDRWVKRLENSGHFTFHPQCEWIGWEGDFPLLRRGDERIVVDTVPLLFALGGATWPETGSDGNWSGLFGEKNIPLLPFKPMNCAFFVDWSDRFDKSHWNQPVKNIALSRGDQRKRGDILLTERGIEGGPVYWFSLSLRESLERSGKAELFVDLMPDLSPEQVRDFLSKRPKKKSLTSYLKSTGRLSPPALSLLLELTAGEERADGALLAERIKKLPLVLTGCEGLDRAISSSGGVDFTALDESLMLKDLPARFVAGEMADWEAPTGGYLIQGCLAMANRAAEAMKGYFL
ncbi:MAG: TIGR03862 family flavoprotein [Spirochaetales bacterium]|nr:TIGR03862 family flavoprotein [Spirochaetales bacterium]